MSADLSWLADDPGVAALRDQYAADMVSLIVNSGSGCGIAYVMRNPGPGFENSAFQVTHMNCAIGNLSYAHEHGHNMGFEHDPANGASPGNASYPWSFGHFVDGSYYTVMSYHYECTPGCTRVAHFSNPDILHPDILHQDQPTGIADERDNARTGDLTASIVAQFRLDPVCGNGSQEGTEECDGDDLGGATCVDVACAGGTPSCTSCTLGYLACSDCGDCDNDDSCEMGEYCVICPNDCFSGPGATCGNGICEAGDGEDCLSCRADCRGKTNGNPNNRYCCGDGDGPNPRPCSDSSCTTQGYQCTDIPAVTSCCGDEICEGTEDGFNCQVDCGSPPVCGDGTCDPGEDRCSCAADCGFPPSTESDCNNGIDEDCDGFADCYDEDCDADPACSQTCEPIGASCSANGDCCSNKCKGPNGGKSCR